MFFIISEILFILILKGKIPMHFPQSSAQEIQHIMQLCIWQKEQHFIYHRQKNETELNKCNYRHKARIIKHYFTNPCVCTPVNVLQTLNSIPYHIWFFFSRKSKVCECVPTQGMFFPLANKGTTSCSACYRYLFSLEHSLWRVLFKFAETNLFLTSHRG